MFFEEHHAGVTGEVVHRAQGKDGGLPGGYVGIAVDGVVGALVGLGEAVSGWQHPLDRIIARVELVKR